MAFLAVLPRLWIPVTHPKLRPNYDFVFRFEKVTPQRNFVPKWVRVVVKRRPMWIPTSWYGQKCNYFLSICIFVYWKAYLLKISSNFDIKWLTTPPNSRRGLLRKGRVRSISTQTLQRIIALLIHRPDLCLRRLYQGELCLYIFVPCYTWVQKRYETHPVTNSNLFWVRHERRF